MTLRTLLLLVLSFFTTAATAADGAIVQLKQFLGDVRSFEASFEQRLFDERGELVETSQGKVCIARPGRFDWNYEQPYRQRIVSDGKTLWVFDADLLQVTINEVTRGAVDSPARLLGDDFDLEAHFNLVAEPSEQDVDWVALSPKSGEAQFKTVRIGLRKGELALMRLKDNLGQTTEVRFSGITRNSGVPASRFEFEPPGGVDIIRGTGG